MRERLTLMSRLLRRYWYLVLALSFAIFSVIVLWQNTPLWKHLLAQQSSLAGHIKATYNMYGIYHTNYSLIGRVTIPILSVLMSLNIVLFGHYLGIMYRVRKGSQKNLGSSVFKNVISNIIGVIGIGCASCGAALISSILSIVGGVGLIRWLPLHGEEFGILGILLVLFSIYTLIKKIHSPYTC